MKVFESNESSQNENEDKEESQSQNISTRLRALIIVSAFFFNTSFTIAVSILFSNQISSKLNSALVTIIIVRMLSLIMYSVFSTLMKF